MTEAAPAETSVKEKAQAYFQLIDKCLTHFVNDQFTEELARAKSFFFESAGVVDETAPDYETRMAQFFDWYFFDNELTGYGLTPLESTHMIRGLRLEPAEQAMLGELKNARHSLFELHKARGTEVTVRDLLKGDKLVVPECHYSFGPEEIFEARLFPYAKQEGGILSGGKEQWLFSRGFCFHPKEAQKFIQSEIKRHRKNPDYGANEMMLKLLKMKYRSERLRHVRIDMIYSEKPHYG